MEVQLIKLNKIKLGKNSRTDVSDEEIAGLMGSIESTGLLQPIGVVRTKSGYDIAYGNRRFMAYSKLGKTTIPAIIYNDKHQADIDTKNLVENVQRRNISLTEVGRYIEMLKDSGLKPPEIAARMGVGTHYINAASKAFREVPEKFRKDIATATTTVGTGSRVRTSDGKISVIIANKIEHMRRKYKLNTAQRDTLYTAAKLKKFNHINLEGYVHQLLEEPDITPSDMVENVRGLTTQVVLQIKMDTKDYDALYKKYITNGPFNTFPELLRSKLNGKTDFRLNIK